MRSTLKMTRVVAAFAALSLVIAACGTDEEETPQVGQTDTETAPDDTDTEEAAAPAGALTTYIGEPESLIPTTDNESEGIAVIRALFSGLVGYDVRTSETFNQVAESIESDDEGTTWNITLKDGWTFHDGSPVTAESFVNAWNYGAYGPNAQENSGFYADIEGFEEAQEGTTEELSGLEVTDELSFTVTLSQAQSFFPQRLGYAAYMPLPEVFYEDPEAFNEAPVGNGPFMMDGEWVHNQQIALRAYPDYAGEEKPKVEQLEFRIFDDVNTAVNELLAGGLDIVDQVPAERAAEVEGQAAFFDESPSSSINYLGFPVYHDQLSNRDLRAALSMAIDRQAITDTIFEGNRQPANALVAPVIPGYEEQPCEAWTYDPEQAKELFDAAGGWEGPMEVWFNAGAGHDAWIEAVTNMWRDTLGIEEFEFQQLQFAEYLEISDNAEFTGPFRLGWGMDYPHPQNYLQLLLQSDFTAPVGANSTFYDSEEFDAQLADALAETDLDTSLPLYQEAQRIACEDVPLAPMFFGLNQFAASERVQNLYVDAFGDINYTEVSVSE